MGYYITLTEANASIKKEHANDVIRAWAELNQLNMLKSAGVNRKSAITGVYGKAESWFSWMSNWTPSHDDFFDTEPKTLEVIKTLQELSFEVENTEETINIVGYDSKIGQEKLFFIAIAKYLEDDFHIYFEGEDEEVFSWDKKSLMELNEKLSRFISLNNKYQNMVFSHDPKREAITKEELQELRSLWDTLYFD